MQSKKEQRKAAAAERLALVKGLFATETAAAIGSAVFYEDGEGRDLEIGGREDATEVTVAWKPLAQALAQAGERRVCVVDPADYVRPSGGFLSGAWNAESQLCSESNLAPVLEGLRGRFHDPNRQYGRGGLNSDRALYIPGVVFTTGGEMRSRDVIAISPVNRQMALENHRSEAECEQDAANRVDALMRIAASNGVDVLVVPPFGCEWGQGEPGRAAELFAEWILSHPGAVPKVIFAIAGGPALDAFRERFPEAAPAGQENRVDGDIWQEDDGDEDESWRDDVASTADGGRWVFE